jgi:hypothetical protein
MDQTDARFDLQGNDLAEVRKMLRADGKLSDSEVARRSWSIYQIDDKAIFDEDACRLASAFRVEDADYFYVSRVCDLVSLKSPVVAYRFEATKAGIEAFQSPSWFEINLEDCLMFNFPVTCAALRPGSVDMTTFVGSAAFVAAMKHV